MLVIPASFQILEELDQQSMAVRIEACGRLCYKSEDKISEGSAEPFVKGIVKHGHNSVLEMAALTLRVEIDSESLVAQFLSIIPKYIQLDRLEKKTLLISGTIRAFRELARDHGKIKLVKAMAGYLAEMSPLFFFDLAPKRGWLPQDGVRLTRLPLAEVDALPADLLAKHRHIAVRFISNRAVTHELVRHRPCSFLQESQRYCRYADDKFGNEITFIKPLFFAEGSEEYRLWQRAMAETEKIYLELLKTSSPQAARTVLPNSCKTEIIVFANLLEWLHILRLRTPKNAEPSMRELTIPLAQALKERFPSVFNEFVLAE
ncbi:MAG: thymidylate synthase complementing protein ThyX [Deltaproteobacteria bacterium RIFOXYD12_FULL_55_16]|nr:MAG: thymidylate synthase complementing protein ThyX [Deltaproteobacteria bacterium RIFOXYD12_FULL_55_16]